MKLEYHCDPEVNNHKECSGKVIQDEKVSNCECECHKFGFNEPHYFGGFGV